MKSELIKFFSVQRQIFGVCSCCGDIFRLSDAKVYLKEKPQPDWMDKLQKSEERLDNQEEKIKDLWRFRFSEKVWPNWRNDCFSFLKCFCNGKR